MNPADRWVGAYAEYEWQHLRKLLEAYRIDVRDRDVLEFGCNVGASSVVLAALGAWVTAIDVSAEATAIARANLERHGLASRATVLHVADTRELPFTAASFDLVIANSVLEYVDPKHLDSVVGELHRVTRGGGRLFVCGTASRIAPREIHSRRWFVNYLPQAVDRWTGRSFQRGIDPFLLAKCLRGRFAGNPPSHWLEARRAVHGKPSFPMRCVDRIAARFGCAPGWLAPNIELSLIRCAGASMGQP